MSVLDHKPKPWEPLVRVVPDPEQVAEQEKLYARYGQKPHPEDEMWRNDEYHVAVRYLSDRGKAGVLHLSIKRVNGGVANDWRELQAIKNEVAGWEREAINLHPAESRLVDEADQTHLWVMPAGVSVEIGFRTRDVKTNIERIEALRPVLGDEAHKPSRGSQRDWRPGISTGPNYHPGG